jgi:hypothetical protein
MLIAFYIYLGCLVFGLLFAILTGIFGGLFSADVGGADVDVGGPEVDANVGVTADAVALSPLSPTVLCFFIGVFGGTGMICLELFETTVPMSIGASTLVGLGSASVFFLGMSAVMRGVQGSMSLSATSILGGTAEVSVPIPEGGLGEITYVANEMRQRASAKSEDGKPIPQRTVVDVLKYTGSFYVVRRGTPAAETAQSEE